MAGVAKRVAALLARQGFTIGNIGNAPRSDFSTSEVHEHTRIAYAGLRVRQALGKPAQSIPVVSDPGAQSVPSDVTVVVGQDLASKLLQQASATP
jgi:hypothetical protein